MCGGPVRVGPSSPSPASREDNGVMDYLTDDSFSSLLELAANNDAGGFRRSLDRDPSAVDEVCLWYGREKGSGRMVLERRTPLMVAATYGSLDVLGLLLSSPSVLVNRASGRDRATALHCAASGGSADAADAVKLLLSAGADPDLVDANGRRPADVVVVPPKLPDPVSSSLDSDGSLSITAKASELQPPAVPEKKEYPVDPSLPDIKNSIYATDEFRMYSFKVRPCSRAYSHDWTECPFVHPGENARRRDPRKYHYSCVPCPDYRKGACRRGDMCEYAHGVFECWLHPAQYRTRPCKDGTSCCRRVCFFAHTNEELRPLHTSTGSALPSPLTSSSAAMEMAAALSLMPGSPSSVSSVMAPFTPPMSPSANGIGHSSFSWAHSNMPPAVHLPGSNLQSSRLRASLSARDMPVDDPMARAKAFALDDIFSAEPASSPKYNSDQGAIFSPSHKTAALSQFQRLQQSLMSPRNMEPISPVSSRLSLLAQREKQKLMLRSLSSRDAGSGTSPLVGSPVNHSWLKWASPTSSLDWEVNGEEHGCVGQPSSFEVQANGEEPDLSWVHSLVRDSPTEKVVAASGAPAGLSSSLHASGIEGLNQDGQSDDLDQAALLGSWLDQLQLDQMVI
ncbi:Zinc finger CCCH domain-containing protein 24 [Musa troglodytarum]|uniref:Zinc finger CCCH domain-containing protein 24 n=1 Tax=Musa troglodytarum TaxID=320322 RepID=A0A9E7E9Q7_9LILI|nr:Zinc finger CCCH domain-containing protein 24 [Musa troglodytarum]